MSALPLVGPPEEGLRRAMADARARRLRSAGATAGLSAAVVSLGVLALGGPATQSLVQQPAPERPAISTVVQGDTSTRSVPDRPDAAPVGAEAADAGPSAVPSPVASALPHAAPGPVGPPTRQVRRYAAGPLTKQSDYLTVPNCAVADAASLCRSVTTYSTSDASTLQLKADVCSTRASTATLHYPGRNEVDFVVRDGRGQVVWQWSTWHPDGGAAHTMTLSTGTCTAWWIDWSMVDARGSRLPKGDYTLTGRYLAEEFAGRRAVTWSFTLS